MQARSFCPFDVLEDATLPIITRLARSGVTPKVAQALARHSTITLTMDRYAHVALADTSKALASRPALPVASAEPTAFAATIILNPAAKSG